MKIIHIVTDVHRILLFLLFSECLCQPGFCHTNDTKSIGKAMQVLRYMVSPIDDGDGQTDIPQRLLIRANSGDPSSQNNLGLYFRKRGNKAKAMEWWEKAASQNHAGACVNLGSLYLEEKDVKAKYWYLKGAELKDSLAYRGLGLYYDKIEKNIDESLKWLRKGADAGDVNSQRILGLWYNRHGDYSMAISYFSPAVEKGDGLSMKGIADAYYNLKDFKNALFWYKERAIQGDLESQCQLSYMYTYGQGTEIDHNEAKYWVKRAADGGLAQAQFNLGLFYSRGSIGLDQNDEKAFEWFKKAADQGHPDGLNNVGVHYYNNGEFEKAMHYWNLAVTKGSKDAEINLKRIK